MPVDVNAQIAVMLWRLASNIEPFHSFWTWNFNYV